MKTPIASGAAALLALAALAGTAVAGPIGSNVSPRMSGNIHGSMSSIGPSSLDRSGGTRGFRKFDDGGPDNPQPKNTPAGPATSGSGSGQSPGDPEGRHRPN